MGREEASSVALLVSVWSMSRRLGLLIFYFLIENLRSVFSLSLTLYLSLSLSPLSLSLSSLSPSLSLSLSRFVPIS